MHFKSKLKANDKPTIDMEKKFKSYNYMRSRNSQKCGKVLKITHGLVAWQLAEY